MHCRCRPSRWPRGSVAPCNLPLQRLRRRLTQLSVFVTSLDCQSFDFLRFRITLRRMSQTNRRPIAVRDRPVFQSLARKMQAAGIRPNTVSITSVVTMVIGATVLSICQSGSNTIGAIGLFLFPLFILVRSICNLIDGMIAVEGGEQTASGEIFNDFPDRISDPIMLVVVGYAAIERDWGVPLGWAAALSSVVVAYARMLGTAAGASPQFIGPMAKTHRMLVISIACIAAGCERLVLESTWSLVAGLGVVVIGCVYTTVRRLRRSIRELESGC